jgi:hypothetical protein
MVQEFDETTKNVSEAKLDDEWTIGGINHPFSRMTLIRLFERLNGPSIPSRVAKPEEDEVFPQGFHIVASKWKRSLGCVVFSTPHGLIQQALEYCLNFIL